MCSLRKFNSTSTMICTNIFISPSLGSFCQTIRAASDKVCKCREYTIQHANVPSTMHLHVHRCSRTCVAFVSEFATDKADRIVEQRRWITKSLVRVVWHRLWDSRPYAFLSVSTESRRTAAKLILIRKGTAYTTGKIKTVMHV